MAAAPIVAGGIPGIKDAAVPVVPHRREATRIALTPAACPPLLREASTASVSLV
jgi:hypothetical protein